MSSREVKEETAIFPLLCGMKDQDKNPWTILDEAVKYDNPWIRVTEYRVLNPNGGKGIYGKVHFKNLAIGIVALDDENNIYLVGQYRFPLDQYSWEIPEGGGPHGIDPLESARRELLEETGLKAGSWEKLLEMHLSNSVSDEYGIIFLATQLSQHDAMPEETEELRVKKIPLDEACEMVNNGTITDSLTVAALLKMQLRIKENTKPHF
jgi:8-oxo-dGTP pyrophosphatase MutT (NUDIX family)